MALKYFIFQTLIILLLACPDLIDPDQLKAKKAFPAINFTDNQVQFF